MSEVLAMNLVERLNKLAGHLEGLDSESGEAKLLREAIKFIEPRTFECAARPWEKRDPPQECNWPCCSCDPYSDKVIEALDEQGYLKRAGYEG